MSSLPKIPEFVRRFYVLSPALAKNYHDDFERFAGYCLFAGKGASRSEFSQELLDYAFAPSEKVIQDPGAPISRFMYEAYRQQPSWHSVFNLTTPEGRLQCSQWAAENGEKVFFRTSGYSVTRALPLSEGVNLIGFASAHFGLGEMYRSTKKALLSANISVHEIDISCDKTIELKHQVNLFCLPGMEHYRLNYSFSAELFKGVYNIGYWPWEISSWPADLNFCFESCDEVWGLSEFNRLALQQSTSKPVVRMPIAVEKPQVVIGNRPKFSLREDFFYFLNIFDFESYLDRKNPVAVVKAFQKAFPKENVTNAKIGLVFKTLHVNPSHAPTASFLKLISADSRIQIIDQDLPKDEIFSLLESIDCAISLHRSEGFGLTLAESMLLKKPVICTNYSGNTDFTRPENAYLVSCEMVGVNGGYHFTETNAVWANPSVEDAALKMNEVYDHPTETAERAAKGKLLIETEYSTQKVGEMMRHRLQNIVLPTSQPMLQE